jgi:hypothetical protein
LAIEKGTQSFLDRRRVSSDVKKLGHELNVRYVLEGSVQRGGNRLRVNVQLIDAETGGRDIFRSPNFNSLSLKSKCASSFLNFADLHHGPCNEGTILRFGRAVCGYFTLAAAVK